MIIERVDEIDGLDGYDEGFPDLFITSKNIDDKDYVKYLTDYFSNKAIKDVKVNIDTFGRNYKFFDGEIDSRDFYEATQDYETDGFITDVLGEELKLPEYVNLYSILTQPINVLAGEISESPDERIVRAYDADSLNEVIAEKTRILEEYISKEISNTLYQYAEEQGLDLKDQQVVAKVEADIEEDIEEQVASITTHGEKWANRKLLDLKARENYREIEEKAVYDLLKVGKVSLHVYEDNSAQGFSAEHIYPAQVSTSLIKGKDKYSESYQNSIVRMMEISEIIDRFPLTKEEIDHIKEYKQNVNSKFSEYQRERASSITGINSIHYKPPKLWNEDTYMRGLIESELCGAEDLDRIFDYMGIQEDLGNYALVVENYILCKELLGELTFIDEEGDEMTVPVNDEYKNGSHPGEISIEWGYVNRWYKAIRIGPEVYKLMPVDYLPGSPVIGITRSKGLLDMLKDRQIIYSLCINQLWELLQKELGTVLSFDWTKIPVGKDEEYEDALDAWMSKAEELGFIFSDNNPEKFKIQQGQQEVAKVLDLNRSIEMRARIELATAIKDEAYEMVGISRSRLGSNLASETATSVTNSRKSSYAQTMHWYNAHRYVFDEFYQAMIDTAQYYEAQNEETTVTLSTTDGERSMLRILGSDISMRDLRVYLTSSPEDLNDLAIAKEMGMTMIQNGTDPYVVSKMLFTNSIREIQDAFKKDRDLRNKMREEDMEHEQKGMHTEYAIAVMKEKSQKEERREIRAHNAKENQLDRISEEKRAVIRAYGFQPEAIADKDDSGTADILEVLDRESDIDEAFEKYERDLLESNKAFVEEQNKISQTANENKMKAAMTRKEIEIKERQMSIDERRAETEEKRVNQQEQIAKYYDKGKKEK